MLPAISNPEHPSLFRSRFSVGVVSLAAGALATYIAWQALSDTANDAGAGLHRSNAVRHPRRARRRRSLASQPADGAGDATDDADAFETMGDPFLGDDQAEPTPQERAGQNIVQLLFRVSEDNARRNANIHRGCACNSCGVVPIRGIRYRCANCADYDLCETCESNNSHYKTHIFYKIRVPAPPFGPRQMQPVWYAGNPEAHIHRLKAEHIRSLTTVTGFERPEIDSFWEQFIYMANTVWNDDPNGIGLAMDKPTFERCLVPSGGSRHATPNLIHDRMFAFYDLDKNGLIGFHEFIDGLAYRKRKDKLERIFQGYDIDGDGYVSRQDFLRMFRAYYVLYKQMHRDILDGFDDQVPGSPRAQDYILGRQPLSSAFGFNDEVPAGNEVGNRAHGKQIHANGHVELQDPDTPAYLEGRLDTVSREDILRRLFSGMARANTVYLTSAPTLLDPPRSVEDLSDMLGGIRVTTHPPSTHGEGATANPAGEAVMSESARRAQQEVSRRRIAADEESERLRVTREQAFARWQRRSFYIDEEEGGVPPEGFGPDDDILHRISSEDSSQTAFDVPDDEHDAGREVLYQVTQQAFNELLDILFKRVEDMAVEAENTREERTRHAEQSKDFDLFLEEKAKEPRPRKEPVMSLAESRLAASQMFAAGGDPDDIVESLLQQAGFTVDPSLRPLPQTSPTAEEEFYDASEGTAVTRDPTMPQFRPNSAAEAAGTGGGSSSSLPPLPPPLPQQPKEIPMETLIRWKELKEAEEKAKERGGWGMLNYAEFEAIYRRQEKLGNRLDYLGSWVDFCIP